MKDKGGAFMNIVTELNNQISVDNKLDKYSKNKLNELKTRNNIVVTTKKELWKKVFESFNDKSSKEEIHLGMISKRTIERIRKEVTGIKKNEIHELFDDNKEYDLSITQDAIRHIKKSSMSIDNVLDIIEKLMKL